MSDFEKSRQKALRFFFFKELSDQCEKANWEKSQLESYEIIHRPAAGRLSITACDACIDFFLESIVILLFLLKDAVLKI